MNFVNSLGTMEPVCGRGIDETSSTNGSGTVPVAFSEARFQVKKSACFWRHGRYQE